MDIMLKAKLISLLAAAAFLGGCNQPAAPVVPGPMDPNSVTVFTLSLQPDSITGCILGDPSMTRPATLTVKNDRAEFVTDGGIHDTLTRVRPNVYTDIFQVGGARLKIEADLSVRPKRLTVATYEGGCKWAATAP
jgi:hypothetical protein